MSFVDARDRNKAAFTDKKRSCIDVPDGLPYFWGEKTLEHPEVSKRQSSGVVVMRRAGISWKEKAPLVSVENTIDGVEYTTTLDDFHQLLWVEYYPIGCLLWKDGAPTHTLKRIQQCFMTEGMTVMQFTAWSPNLNVVENYRGTLVRVLYHGDVSSTLSRSLKKIYLRKGKNSSCMRYTHSFHRCLRAYDIYIVNEVRLRSNELLIVS